jgi:hypothetical protein
MGAKKISDPAFYERHENLTLIGTGMGRGRDENYLVVSANKGEITFNIKFLNDYNSGMKLEQYSWQRLTCKRVKCVNGTPIPALPEQLL